MDGARKEFQVEVRVRNNLLLSRRKELGLTQVEASKEMGISQSALGDYENLKINPLSANGEWKETALKISNFFRCLPEDVWPEVMASVVQNKIVREVSSSQMNLIVGAGTYTAALPPSDHVEHKMDFRVIQMALSGMSDRERDMVEKHFGLNGLEMTYAEIGKEYNLSSARVRQIIGSVLRKIRCSKEVVHRNIGGSFDLGERVIEIKAAVKKREKEVEERKALEDRREKDLQKKRDRYEATHGQAWKKRSVNKPGWRDHDEETTSRERYRNIFVEGKWHRIRIDASLD